MDNIYKFSILKKKIYGIIICGIQKYRVLGLLFFDDICFRALAINIPGLIFITTTCCMIGVVMFAFYADCHPIDFNGLVNKPDEVRLYRSDRQSFYLCLFAPLPGPALGGAEPNWEQFRSAQIPSQTAPRSVIFWTRDPIGNNFGRPRFPVKLHHDL